MTSDQAKLLRYLRQRATDCDQMAERMAASPADQRAMEAKAEAFIESASAVIRYLGVTV